MTMWAKIKEWFLWQWVCFKNLGKPGAEEQLFDELEKIHREQLASRMMTIVPRYSMRCECENCKIRPWGIIMSADGEHCNDCGRKFWDGSGFVEEKK